MKGFCRKGSIMPKYNRWADTIGASWYIRDKRLKGAFKNMPGLFNYGCFSGKRIVWNRYFKRKSIINRAL